MTYDELSSDVKKLIIGELKSFFDEITIYTASHYIMEVLDAPDYFIESFYPWNIANNQENIHNAFIKHKIKLFSTGVRLYKRNSLDEISLICDVEQEYWESIQ